MQISPVINLIILLSFTYFIASLLISAINESIAGTLRLRAKKLEKGMKSLFFEADWKEYIGKHFLKSPFIESLMKEKERYPAYIPAKNFAMAVLTHCSIDRNKLNAPDVIDAIQASTCLPQKMKDLIKGYITEGQVKLEDIEKELEEFYNNAMDRVSGWYKQQVRIIIFILSFGLAGMLNIDTIKIVADGLSDKTRLAASADGIAQQVASINKDGSMRVITNGDTVRVTTTVTPALGLDSTKSFKEVVDALSKQGQQAKDIVMVYGKATGFEMGYPSLAAVKEEWLGNDNSSHFWIFMKKIMGLLLTAFALQMGSGYWFGVLNKVVSIRAAGVKPEEKTDDAANKAK